MPGAICVPLFEGTEERFPAMRRRLAKRVQRPMMKFVATKTADQFDSQGHRTGCGSGWSASAPASSINRNFPVERRCAQGLWFRAPNCRASWGMPRKSCRSAWVRVIEDLAGDWRRLDELVGRVHRMIEAVARKDAGCERLMSVPGIGPDHPQRDGVAAIGTGDKLKGRDFLAAWLGLVPEATLTGLIAIHPRQDIEARQSLPASCSAGVVVLDCRRVGSAKGQHWDRGCQAAAAPRSC